MNYKVKSRIWIETDGKVLLGEGRIKLLNEISQLGSLSKAAKSMGMSYNKAWKLIDSINKSAKKPVVIKTTGGKGGGGTRVTPHGEKLIDMYKTINTNCWNYLDGELKKMKL
jgi:molybdate transport system regulatory protein